MLTTHQLARQAELATSLMFAELFIPQIRRLSLTGLKHLWQLILHQLVNVLNLIMSLVIMGFHIHQAGLLVHHLLA